MENFATLIKNRRSTRKYRDQLMNPDQVEMILKAALMAPAGKRKNPWQFIVVEDKTMLEKLSDCKPHGAAFLKECAMAVVVMANVMESDTWIEDCSIAATFMQLQAEDLGLGSCWVQVRGRDTEDDMDSAQYVRQLFDVPYQMDVLCIIGMGYKDQERAPFDEANLQWEKIHIGTYKAPSKPNEETIE